jgi:Protein of unknown function (DUF2490)
MRFAIMAAAMVAVMPGNAVAATADDLQIWGVLNLSTDLSPKVVGNLELGGRLVEDTSRLGVALIRPTIGYKVNNDLVLHIGYAHFTTINRGVPNLEENRFFQQTNWRVGKIGKVTVNSRTRIELRTVEGARDTGWRLRQRVQLQIPMKTKGVNLLVATEQFFALNSTTWGARAGFDQMRNFIGVSVPVGKALTIETGFQHRYQRRVGIPDRSDFVVPVTLSMKL